MSRIRFSNVEIIELPFVAGAEHPSHNQPVESDDDNDDKNFNQEWGGLVCGSPHQGQHKTLVKVDVPTRLDSAAITLDWKAQRITNVDIETFEKEREKDKNSKIKRLTRAVRKRILRRSGIETSDIESDDENGRERRKQRKKKIKKSKQRKKKLRVMSRFRSQDRFAASQEVVSTTSTTTRKEAPEGRQQENEEPQTSDNPPGPPPPESRDGMPRLPTRCLYSPEPAQRKTLDISKLHGVDIVGGEPSSTTCESSMPTVPQHFLFLDRLPALSGSRRKGRKGIFKNEQSNSNPDHPDPTHPPSPTKRHSHGSMHQFTNAMTSLAKQPVKLANPVKMAYMYSTRKFTKRSSSGVSDDEESEAEVVEDDNLDVKRGGYKLPDLPFDSEDERETGIQADEAVVVLEPQTSNVPPPPPLSPPKSNRRPQFANDERASPLPVSPSRRSVKMMKDLAKQPGRLARSTKKRFSKESRGQPSSGRASTNTMAGFPSPPLFDPYSSEDELIIDSAEFVNMQTTVGNTHFERPPADSRKDYKFENKGSRSRYSEPSVSPFQRGRKSIGQVTNAVVTLAKQPVILASKPVMMANSTRKRIMKKRRERRESRKARHDEESSCSSDGSHHDTQPPSFNALPIVPSLHNSDFSLEGESEHDKNSLTKKPTVVSMLAIPCSNLVPGNDLEHDVAPAPSPATLPPPVHQRKKSEIGSLDYMKNAVGVLAKQPAKLAKSTKRRLTTKMTKKKERPLSPKFMSENETEELTLSFQLTPVRHQDVDIHEDFLSSDDEIELIDDSPLGDELDSVLDEDADYHDDIDDALWTEEGYNQEVTEEKDASPSGIQEEPRPKPEATSSPSLDDGSHEWSSGGIQYESTVKNESVSSPCLGDGSKEAIVEGMDDRSTPESATSTSLEGGSKETYRGWNESMLKSNSSLKSRSSPDTIFRKISFTGEVEEVFYASSSNVDNLVSPV